MGESNIVLLPEQRDVLQNLTELKLDGFKREIEEQYCDALDLLAEEFDGVSFEIDVDEITTESRLKEDVGLSSVAMLYMAVSIENEFEIDLSDANMNDLVTVGDVVELIEKYL